MKNFISGRLRTISYDTRVPLQHIQHDKISALQYGGVSKNNNYQ